MQHLINYALSAMSQHSNLAYIIIFGIAFLESFAFIGLVVPGAVFAVSAGFFAARGILNIWSSIIAGALGAILADLGSFYLARFYGEKLVNWKSYRKCEPYMEKGKLFFAKHGGKSVFLGRFIGFIRPVIPFMAGLLRMNPTKFWFYAVSSGILWGIAYIGAGYVFGESWKVIEAWTGKLSIVLLALLAAGYLLKRSLTRIGSKLNRLYRVMVSFIDTGRAALADNPYVLRFSFKHPELVQFIKQRFKKSEASGLLLTTGFGITALFSYFFIAIIEDIVFHDPLTNLDITLFYTFQNIHSRLADEFFVFINSMSSGPTLTVSFLVLLGILVIYRKVTEGFFYIFNFLGALAFLISLKYLFHRPRPDAIYHFYTAATPSFPSGHTFVSVTVLGLALYYLIRFAGKRQIKTLAILIYFLFIALVGLSHLYLGVHWLSDVLGAWFAGFVWVSMIITAYEYVNKKYRHPRIFSGRMLTPICGILLVAGGLLGNTLYAAHQTKAVVSKVRQIPPVYSEFNGKPSALLLQHVSFYTQTLLGNPATPIQAVFVGRWQHVAKLLQSAGFVRLESMSAKQIIRLLKLLWNQRMDSSLPCVPYYYQNRSQDSAWAISEGPRPYPRIVVRIWNAHMRINGRKVIVATIERESGLRHFLGFRIPLPLSAVSLPEARKKFLSFVRATDANIQLLRAGKPSTGKNILHRSYYFDGGVLLIACASHNRNKE